MSLNFHQEIMALLRLMTLQKMTWILKTKVLLSLAPLHSTGRSCFIAEIGHTFDNATILPVLLKLLFRLP